MLSRRVLGPAAVHRSTQTVCLGKSSRMLVHLNAIFPKLRRKTMDIEPTKHGGTGTKHGGTGTKHGGTGTKGQAEDMMETYSTFGAYGDYEVTMPDGERVLYSAVTVRVLGRGELNLATDTGQWFLFVASAWSKVAPAQPRPGKVNADRPN